MRPTSSLLCSALLLSLLGACKADNDDPVPDNDPAGSGGEGGEAGSGPAGTGGGGGPGGQAGASGAGGSGGSGGMAIPGKVWPACAPQPPSSAEYVPAKSARAIAGSVTPLGLTNDGHLVYREGSKTLAAQLGAQTGAPSVLSEQQNTVLFRGNVVFVWTNVDYTKGEADLTAWTGSDCLRPIGRTASSDDLVAASDDGSMLLFATNVTETTLDLEVAARDLSWRSVLVTGMGRASESTCRAQYGFAGSRVVVGYCPPGSLAANVEIYDGKEGSWQKAPIASDAQPAWSADAQGDRIFFITSGSQGRLWGGQDMGEIDAGVVWGKLLPDGSGALYTVGDQLRRTTLPEVVAIPIVTNKFRRAQRWSPDLSQVLYSSEISFEGVERYDLLLTPTTAFNPTPRKLVAAVDAQLSRDAFSADGKFTAYLTGVNGGTGLLHVHNVATAQDRTSPGVGTVAAGHDGVMVFSDNLSAPNVYPATASLKVWNAALAGPPQPLEAQIVDHRNFFVTPNKRAVVYQRLNDPQVENSEGIWLTPLP
jgi:hypothetical protein